MIEQYFQGQWMFVLKLIIAALLGFIIAWDRKQYGKGAGMRTYALIAMGACLFTITSLQFDIEPARIAAGVVTGIGFIGAGIIWQRKGSIVGVTTAAGVWVAAAIGLTVALDLWLLATAASLFSICLFASRRIISWS